MNDCLRRTQGYLLRPHSAVGLDDNDLADLLNRLVESAKPNHEESDWARDLASLSTMIIHACRCADFAFRNAFEAGERNPAVLASMRDRRCHSSTEVIEKALTGHYQNICLYWNKRWRSMMCISRRFLPVTSRLSLFSRDSVLFEGSRMLGQRARARHGAKADNRMGSPSMLAKHFIACLEKI
jgi:hypothetical protein